MKFFRTCFFMFLFGVGVGAFSLAALSADVYQYYERRRAVAQAEIHLANLHELNDNYDVLLVQLETEPNALTRLAPVVVGNQSSDPNIVHPYAALSLKMQARQVVANYQVSRSVPDYPNWLIRIREPRRLTALYFSGGCLVLIAVVWFGVERRRQPVT